MKHTLSCTVLIFMSLLSYSQDSPDILERIVVECYYRADAQDAADTDGGSIAEGAITYRVYADLQEGYTVKAVFGNELNLLEISTSTEFFNNEDRGEETGDAIDSGRLDENTVALDSWVTIGAASSTHKGLLKLNDTDGSVLFPNDLGLLANQPTETEFTPYLQDADGLFDFSVAAVSQSPGLDLSMFGDQNDGPLFFVGGPDYVSSGDTWFVAEGVSGVDTMNHVLLGQFTTDGDFSFKFNIQVGIPDDPFTAQFVAELDENYQPSFSVYEHPELSQDNVVCNALPVSVAEFQPLNKFINAFPNPTDGLMTIEFRAPSSEQAPFYNLVDHLGRIVQQGRMAVQGASLHRVDLNVEGLDSGIYFLRVEHDGELGMKKLIKH